jgi:hypothetical protein
MDAYV